MDPGALDWYVMDWRRPAQKNCEKKPFKFCNPSDILSSKVYLCKDTQDMCGPGIPAEVGIKTVEKLLTKEKGKKGKKKGKKADDKKEKKEGGDAGLQPGPHQLSEYAIENFDRTVMHYAALKAPLHICKLLIKRLEDARNSEAVGEMDCTVQDRAPFLNTPLHYAIYMDREIAVIDAFARSCFYKGLMVMNGQNKTPLMVALDQAAGPGYARQNAIVELLINYTTKLSPERYRISYIPCFKDSKGNQVQTNILQYARHAKLIGRLVETLPKEAYKFVMPDEHGIDDARFMECVWELEKDDALSDQKKKDNFCKGMRTDLKDYEENGDMASAKKLMDLIHVLETLGAKKA